MPLEGMSDDPPEQKTADTPITRLTWRDVEDARRLLSLFAHVSGKIVIEPAPPVGDQEGVVAADILISKAREILDDRRRREDVLGRAMFGEPAWDILLWLYVLSSGPRQTVSSLANLINASKSTTLRWVDYLDSQRLIRREPHPTDRRAAFVELTEKGRGALGVYLSGTLREKR